MANHPIIIAEADYQRLTTLLESDFVKAMSPAEYLDNLRAELRRAQVVPRNKVPRTVVTMNSTVTLRDIDTGEKETYTLVYPDQADIVNNRLSVLAPVGTAILGQRVGDELKWRVPSGWRRLRVQRIISQPEREGIVEAEPSIAMP